MSINRNKKINSARNRISRVSINKTGPNYDPRECVSERNFLTNLMNANLSLEEIKLNLESWINRNGICLKNRKRVIGRRPR